MFCYFTVIVVYRSERSKCANIAVQTTKGHVLFVIHFPICTLICWAFYTPYYNLDTLTSIIWLHSEL